jgi:hypothetical protein
MKGLTDYITESTWEAILYWTPGATQHGGEVE